MDSMIVLQDSWFGDNYEMHLEEFEKRWMVDPNYENRKKWFFAIKH